MSRSSDLGMMKRVVPVLLFVTAAALLLASAARAHASLARSVPEAGAVLAQPPPAILLEFSEALDPSVTRLELLDVSGQVVAPGPGVIEPGEPRLLRLELDPLPDGTYTAIWRARSAVDGHTTNGSVGFSVGEASSPASLLPPPGTPDPARALPAAAEVIARWTAYLSAAIALGSLSFGFLAWRPAHRQALQDSASPDETIRRLIRRVTLGGLAALAIATLAFVVILAAEALEVPFWRALGAPLSQLFVGRIGWLLAARLLLIAILGWLVLRLPSPGTGASGAWRLILLLGSLISFTFSLQGHGAARGEVLSVVVIWLHLVATVVWLGGLPMLFLTLREAGVPAAALVSRFSEAALICVGVIAATGMYNAFVYVGTGEALIATTYGRALLAKTGIFVLLLALGAVNLLILSPRLRKAVQAARAGLARTVPAEIALGIVLLLAVGVLSGVSPAFDALQAHREQGIIEAASVDGVDMMLRVMPGEGGENEIGVEFTDRRAGATAVPPEVLLRVTMLSMHTMGTQQIPTTSVDGLRYTARGSYFAMAGPWELEIIIRRPGFNDVRQTFELDIQESASHGGHE